MSTELAAVQTKGEEEGDGDVRTRSSPVVAPAKTIILTAPMSLDEKESGSSSRNSSDYRAPNLLHRILTVLKSLRPGTDLTHIQVPPIFNMPKSVLQSFGESVYCVREDILGRCANGDTSLDRFLSVVAWNISTIRPFKFGVAFYNPILGETHHVSRGHLNVLLEQVSHHPPVSALHATNEKDGLVIIWCHRIVPKFHGTKVDAEVQGTRQLKLVRKGETYLMSHPNLEFRLLPVPGIRWCGKFTVRCPQTDLEAELRLVGNSFLGGSKANQGAIKGKILVSSSNKAIFDINGHWDRTVAIKDMNNGNVSVIYDATQMLSGLNTPVVKDPMGVWSSESAVVWSKVSQEILDKNWERAREAKCAIEDKQRELVKERDQSRGDQGDAAGSSAASACQWLPKYFTVSHTKEDGWTCSPKLEWVPPAPIVVPI